MVRARTELLAAGLRRVRWPSRYLRSPVSRLRFALPLLLALSACGGDGAAEQSTPAPGSGPEIVSIAIDPADGTLLMGSGPAFYRLAPGAKTPEAAKGALSTPKGSGTLTRDVIARFQKPGTIIASGHSGESTLPPVLGLVRSTDGGETWQPISGFGEADYHEIEFDGDRILALRNEDPGLIQLSTDGGSTWERREAPSASLPIDVAVNPGDSSQWAVSSDAGVFVSRNDGHSWRQRDTTSGARIAWGAPDALYGVGRDGTVRTSADGGSTWRETGSLGAAPTELMVSPKGELYASVAGGEVRRSADDGATWETVITLAA